MRTTKLIAILLSLAFATPAHPLQIGPEIRVGGGELTIGGVGIKDGKPAVPTIDQVIDTYIDSTPLVLLSDADKKNIREAVKATGFAAAIIANPVTGIVLVTVMQPDGTRQDVPVPTNDLPSTGKTWNFAATCMVQQADGLITSFFSDDPEHLSEINFGDTLVLTSKVCPEYKEKAVSAATVRFTGRSDFPNAAPPIFKHYIVGRLI